MVLWLNPLNFIALIHIVRISEQLKKRSDQHITGKLTATLPTFGYPK